MEDERPRRITNRVIVEKDAYIYAAVYEDAELIPTDKKLIEDILISYNVETRQLFGGPIWDEHYKKWVRSKVISSHGFIEYLPIELEYLNNDLKIIVLSAGKLFLENENGGFGSGFWISKRHFLSTLHICCPKMRKATTKDYNEICKQSLTNDTIKVSSAAYSVRAQSGCPCLYLKHFDLEQDYGVFEVKDTSRMGSKYHIELDNIVCTEDIEIDDLLDVKVAVVAYNCSNKDNESYQNVMGTYLQFLALDDEHKQRILERFDFDECFKPNEKMFAFGRVMGESFIAGSRNLLVEVPIYGGRGGFCIIIDKSHKYYNKVIGIVKGGDKDTKWNLVSLLPQDTLETIRSATMQ